MSLSAPYEVDTPLMEPCSLMLFYMLIDCSQLGSTAISLVASVQLWLID
jgi:hypothetical protein